MLNCLSIGMKVLGLAVLLPFLTMALACFPLWYMDNLQMDWRTV
jgi:hypothetical protein